MKKIIIKKSNKFKVLYLKVKSALFNNNKLVVINNYNVLNLKSKELNKMLQTKLVNNNIVRGLKLKFPISGLSKIIKFKTLSELNTILLTISTNKPFFDVLLIKLFNKVYNLSKFSNLYLKPNFLNKKKVFFSTELVSRVTNLNFLQSSFFLSILSFLTILNKKNDQY